MPRDSHLPLGDRNTNGSCPLKVFAARPEEGSGPHPTPTPAAWPGTGIHRQGSAPPGWAKNRAVFCLLALFSGSVSVPQLTVAGNKGKPGKPWELPVRQARL